MTTKNFDLKTEIEKEIPSVDGEKKSGGFKDALKSVLTNQSSETLPSAEDAFLRATYKEYTDKKKIFRDFMRRTKDNIRSRVEQNKLWAIIMVEPELIDCASEVREAIVSYGYKVWILGKEELEQLQPDTVVNKTMMFMLVTWDKVY